MKLALFNNKRKVSDAMIFMIFRDLNLFFVCVPVKPQITATVC